MRRGDSVLAAPDLTGVLAWLRSDAHRSSPCYDLLLRLTRFALLLLVCVFACWPRLEQRQCHAEDTGPSALRWWVNCLMQREIERYSSEATRRP